MVDAIGRFRQLFVGWVKAHNESKSYSSDPNAMLERLDARIPAELQKQIGGAFLNGWLRNDDRTGNGYIVRSVEPKGRGVGLNAITGKGKGEAGPWWEFYVQIADFSKLRTMAEERGLTVRLEDRLMDIAVWAGESLLLYVENKVEERDAAALVKRMIEYGVAGFDLSSDDRRNDPLRKAKYLFNARARPEYFAVSAVGYQKVYRVLYGDENNQFTLEPVGGSILDPVLNARDSGAAPERRGVDMLVSALDRLVGNRVWVSPGTGQTAANVYVSALAGDAIALGLYEDGRVWTNTRSFGSQSAGTLAKELGKRGVELDTSKGWAFWKAGGADFVLLPENADAVAEAMAAIV